VGLGRGGLPGHWIVAGLALAALPGAIAMARAAKRGRCLIGVGQSAALLACSRLVVATPWCFEVSACRGLMVCNIPASLEVMICMSPNLYCLMLIKALGAVGESVLVALLSILEVLKNP
jgi:hypothetical protein